MIESVMATQEAPAWPQRTAMLCAIGAIAALLIQQLAAPQAYDSYPVAAWRTATATGIGAGALAFGFGLSRVRSRWTIAFALALGLVVTAIVWWNGNPKGPWNWGGASLALSVAIALPLFQTGRDEGRRAFPYRSVYDHAWTNVVLWGACWAFAGLVLILSHLLAELFALIGMVGLKTLLDKNWSNALVIGAAFGAALGLFRDREVVVRLLQRVATAVLGVLAPVLGVALILFIVSLPFTGLGSLWEATKSTTPVLIACVIGALVLANVVIGHGPEDEVRSPILRWSALALGVAILPLAVLAAIAMGLRIGQYGMTPDRLWGLVVVVFAVGYGAVYLADALRGRRAWAPLVRRDNVRLAFATMAVALVLATPLPGFNAISARDQVARLQSGRTSVDTFDWRALAFDFGESGRDALVKLQRSGDPAVRARATAAAVAKYPYQIVPAVDLSANRAKLAGNVRILPAGSNLPDALADKLAAEQSCIRSRCALVFVSPTEAILLFDSCFERAKDTRDPRPVVLIPDYFRCRVATRYAKSGNAWSEAQPPERGVPEGDAVAAGYAKGVITVRTVPRRQVFVGGVPIGDPFE